MDNIEYTLIDWANEIYDVTDAIYEYDFDAEVEVP